MPKPKIFIASSTRLLNIAKALKNHLLLSETCDADLWSEVSQGQIGSSIVEMLLKATSEYDFAVIILGKDDVTLTEKGEETRKSRDNCIFEAGLFMGVIGQKRCLLLTSLEEKANEKLPADLGGLIYLKFVEPTDFDDEKQCIDETKLASLVIGRKVRAAAPLSNRPLTEKALLEREENPSRR